jgi:HPt (histidine-containing phosphotransfer) domain-containing protein
MSTEQTDRLASIDLTALAKIDAKIEKLNERLASAARANRNLTRSTRELKIEGQIAEAQRDRAAVCGGVLVIATSKGYRAL